MNRMADGVLKDMNEMQKKEDEMIQKYMKMRDEKVRQQEEEKLKKRKSEQTNINRTLAR
jgi:hypothetical protein